MNFKKKNKNKKETFKVIEKHLNFEIVYHTETKVMYSYSTGIYCAGILTLLVNADGTPMLYNEEKEI